jgi:dipeptidase
MTRRLIFPGILTILTAALILTVSPVAGTAIASMQDEHTYLASGCTSIMVGRLATTDGSVITSHTCDGIFRTWLNVSPHRTNAPGTKNTIYGGQMRTKDPLDQRLLKALGEIPEGQESFSFLNTAYPCVNEHQLSIGETSIMVRDTLRNLKGGIFHIEEIQRLMLERCRTAVEAIRLGDELTKRYGYIDYSGECLTIADPKEVWHFEIAGATPKYIGAVWAAVRIPDDHVGVSANISRISEIDLNDPDRYMASANIFSLAEEMGWWDPKSGKPFKFYEVYGSALRGQKKKNFSDREWRVLSLAAPSLGLDPKADEMPFSVKAERKISVRDVIAWFRDTYVGTIYDQTRNLIVTRRDKKQVVSPVASPWMDGSLTTLLNTLKPESVPRAYVIPNDSCSYSTVIQARSWLPDPIGGIVWFGFDNPAHSARMPLYCGITKVPPDFEVSGQNGFTTSSASWAFRRVSRLAGVKWGMTRPLVDSLIQELEDQAFAELPDIEKRVVALYEKNPDKARAFLTTYCENFARAVTRRYWELGDTLWDMFVYDFNLTPEKIKSFRK